MSRADFRLASQSKELNKRQEVRKTDCTVSTGIGFGSKDQQMAYLSQMISFASHQRTLIPSSVLATATSMPAPPATLVAGTSAPTSPIGAWSSVTGTVMA